MQPQTLPLVQLQLIKPLISALKVHGIDPETVLERVGLTQMAVEPPGAAVHVMVIHEFLEACADATQDKCFCAKVATRLDTAGWPMIRQAMTEAATLGSFLRIYVSKSTQVASSVTAYLDIRGETATFGEARRFKPLIVPAQNDGFMISLSLSLLRYVLGKKLEENKVTLVVSDPDVLPETMRKYKVLRGDDMGSKVQFPAEWLGAPLTSVDTPTEPSQEAFNLESADLLSSFRAVLLQHISQGGLTVKETAALVHMHPKKLARRLSAFGTSASQEIRAAKMEYAKRSLAKSGRNIQSISLDLGYSDASNFSRAFAKETGENPNDYRARSKTHPD